MKIIPEMSHAKKKYHSVRTVPKSKRKIAERVNINRFSTQIRDLVQAHP
jgi:hypothetical protein